MTETSLTQEQARTLLEKLATDDNFRTLFETTPARALRQLGVDAETIVCLPPACLCCKCCKELAPKEHYRNLLEGVAEEAISSTMKMFIPQIGFNGRQS